MPAVSRTDVDVWKRCRREHRDHVEVVSARDRRLCLAWTIVGSKKGRVHLLRAFYINPFALLWPHRLG